MATMNFSIPFMGVQPDFVNALASGQQAAAQRNEISRMNALAQLYQAQGPGIAAGEQEALNALAQFDPMAVIGVQDARQGMDARALNMDATRLGMDATRQNMDMQLQQWAASMDEQERQAQLRQGQETMARIANANTPELFDALMIEMGQPEQVGQFAMRDQMINNMRDPLDVLARYDAQNAPQPTPSPQSAIAKLEADHRAGLISAEQYQIGMQNLAPPGMEITSTPDGGLSFRQGVGVAAAPSGNLTEGQSKNILYATRARAALEELDGVNGEPGNADALTGFWNTMADAAPLGLGRYAQTPEYQAAQNAGERFLQAILRKDTGAAITREETASYGGVYLPRPGDTPEMSEVRRQARQQALLALEYGMTPDEILAQGQALVASGARTTPQSPMNAPDMPPGFATAPSTLQAIGDTDLTPEEIWRYLTPEARRMFTEQAGQ